MAAWQHGSNVVNIFVDFAYHFCNITNSYNTYIIQIPLMMIKDVILGPVIVDTMKSIYYLLWYFIHWWLIAYHLIIDNSCEMEGVALSPVDEIEVELIESDSIIRHCRARIYYELKLRANSQKEKREDDTYIPGTLPKDIYTLEASLKDAYTFETSPEDIFGILPKDTYIPGTSPKDTYIFGTLPKDAYILGTSPKDIYTFETSPEDTYTFETSLEDTYTLKLLQKIYKNIANELNKILSKQNIIPQLRQILLCSGFIANNNGV
eukprot:396776_1